MVIRTRLPAPVRSSAIPPAISTQPTACRRSLATDPGNFDPATGVAALYSNNGDPHAKPGYEEMGVQSLCTLSQSRRTTIIVALALMRSSTITLAMGNYTFSGRPAAPTAPDYNTQLLVMRPLSFNIASNNAAVHGSYALSFNGDDVQNTAIGSRRACEQHEWQLQHGHRFVKHCLSNGTGSTNPAISVSALSAQQLRQQQHGRGSGMRR